MFSAITKDEKKSTSYLTPLFSQSLLLRRIKSGKARIDDLLGLEKYCTECAEYWPQDTEFWAVSNTNPDGLQHICRACQSVQKRKSRKKASSPKRE